MPKRLLAGTTALAIGLTGLFASSAPAQNGGGAGFDGPSRALEQAFKVALLERRKTPDGCYPTAKPLAAAIEAGTSLTVGIIANQNQIKKRNIAYVVSSRTRCNRAYIAFLGKKGLYVLDSDLGPIYVVGDDGKRVRGTDSIVGSKGPLRSLRLVSKTTTLTNGDEVKRETVSCPKGSFPMGGGMFGTPSPSPITREGAYPHSYERLGVQRGWHINPVLIDPDRAAGTTPRTVTIQTLCGRGLAPSQSPHKTVFVKPGQTKVAVARCPGGTTLYSGGFQRADFRTPSGSYPTESRAVGNTWRVTGQAFGAFGGEMTSIAYCSPEKSARVQEVSFTAPVLLGQFAEATTPACPGGTKLVSGGFSSEGATGIFADGGHYNPQGSWTAGAFGYFGPAASFTAFGYCAKG